MYLSVHEYIKFSDILQTHKKSAIRFSTSLFSLTLRVSELWLQQIV